MTEVIQARDMSLPVDVHDFHLRTIMQYAKHSLRDFMELLHLLQMYQPIQPNIVNRLDIGVMELLVIHREFGKSTMIEDLIAKELAFKEKAFVIIFGKSDDAAEERVGSAKNWFERPKLPNGKNNPLIQLQPKKKGKADKSYKWSAKDFVLTNGNRCRGQGILSSVLGIKQLDIRPTLIILDDVVDPENPSDDKKMIKRLAQTIIPLGLLARLILLGTPRRYTDVIMTNLRDKKSMFKKHFFPAVKKKADGEDEIVCPEFWMREGPCCSDIGNPAFKCHGLKGMDLAWIHIGQMKRKVKSVAWSSEFLLQPIDDGSSLFPMPTLNPCLMILDNNKPLWSFKLSRKRAYRDNKYQKEKGVQPQRIICVIGVDLQISESEDADFDSFTVLSCEQGKPMRLLHGERHRGLKFKEKKARLAVLNALFRPELVKVEDNGWQIVYADDMAEWQVQMPIDGHTTHTEKHRSTIGIPSMKTVFENENFEFPYGTGEEPEFDEILHKLVDYDEETQEYVDNLFHELNGLIFEDGLVKSVTENDDCGISLWLAYMAAKEYLDNQVIIYDGVSLN